MFTDVLQSLSNVVTVRANGRLLGVGSYGRARGLLQKPALPPGEAGWRNFNLLCPLHLEHPSFFLAELEQF